MLGFRIRYFGEIFSPGFGAGYALPAFLNAVLRVTLGSLVRLPAMDIAVRNAGVHDLADGAGLPLCRDVRVAQSLRIELLGTHPVTRVVLQKGIDHARLRILLHEVLLMGLQRFLHANVRGLPQKSILVKHILKNSMHTCIVAMGMSIPQLISGTIVVENVFSWPGLGTLCISSIFNRDYPVIQTYLLLIGVLFVLFNLLFDILQTVSDPRLRKED